MGDFMTDIGKLINKPLERIDDAQKSIRNAAVKFIEVDENENERSQQFLKNEDLEDPDKDHYMLESLRHWDVTMPATRPKKRFGYSVPSFLRNFNKKRRITIELYKKGPSSGQSPKEKEIDRRVFQKLHPRASVIEDSPFDEEISPLGEEDFIIFRILKGVKPKKGVAGAYEWDDDESHSSSHFNGAFESHQLITYNVKDYGDGKSQENLATNWMERQRARIPTMEIESVTEKSIKINIGVGSDAVLREFKFASSHDVETFVKTFEKMQELMHERGNRMAAEHRMRNSPEKLTRTSFIDEHGSLRLPTNSGFLSSYMGNAKEKESLSNNRVNILIEIVSAANLPIADITSSDPYVIVEDGQTVWHETGVVPSTLNPVWTLSTGSLFVIQTSLSDFFARAAHIEFVVKDHDRIGSNDILASVLVNKTDLLKGTGKRVDYELTTAKINSKRNEFIGKKKSFLTIRAKSATEEEIAFLRSFKAKKETGIMSKIGLSSGTVTGIYSDDSSLPPRTHKNTTNWKTQKKMGSDVVSMKYRLKPFADPNRPEEATKWLTEAEIEHECQKPSENWVEAGSGSIGKFYVEILGCDDLPNTDISITGRSKSDPFVCIDFEDSVVNTDVINDCLSPRWMPWTRRAFVFNVMHPSSQFYIAVMDFDGVKSAHDRLGRCVVNPSNTRSDTIYSLRYNILDSDDVDRKVTGKIMLRCRFEKSSPRQYLLSAFQWRQTFRVSTTSVSDSQTMAFALTNDYDAHALSLFSIQKYTDELFEYQLFLDDMIEGITAVILWRGHLPVQLFSCSFKIPLHSMTAFTWGILLSLNFDRFISFICFVPAWILFATMQVQRRNPNPWKRPPTYLSMLGALILDTSYGQHQIAENENIEAIMDHDEQREERMKLRKEAIDRMTVQNEQDAQRLEKEKEELDKQTHDHTANVTVGLNQIVLSPFKDILQPVQTYLFMLCVILRVQKNILMWRDSVVAFWIATISCSLAAILFFVPWTFLFRWMFRVAAISLLGPWMKLVDIFYVENDENLTRAERREKMEREMKERYEFLLSQSKITRMYQEHEMKFNDMHKYLYGAYGHRVPVFKEERYGSVPLSGGSAKAYDPSGKPSPNIVRRINGQILEGDMIMKRKDSAREFKAAQKQKKLMESQVPPVIDARSNNGEMEPLLEGDEESGYGAVEI